MPDIGGGKSPRRRELNFGDTATDEQGKRGQTGSARKKSGGSPAPPPKKRSQGSAPRQPKGQILFDEGDEDEDGEEDEIIQASLSNKKKIDNKLVGLIGGGVVLILILIFVVMGRGSKEPDPVPVETTPPATTEPEPDDPLLPQGGGIQNFLGDTNNTSDSPLSNPDGFVEDVQGLTMRVEYDVTAITTMSDFVNYEKKRGTWGGGLELYWLDADYKGTHYVIQIPFKYYKELDDVGIVPVSVEVLQVKQPTGEIMYVYSYMTLDEQLLQTYLKNQGKK